MIKFDKRNYRKHNDRNKELIKKSLEECGEIWKDIKDFEGYYQISNKGNVRSLERFVYCKSKTNPNRIKECMLKPRYDIKYSVDRRTISDILKGKKLYIGAILCK